MPGIWKRLSPKNRTTPSRRHFSRAPTNAPANPKKQLRPASASPRSPSDDHQERESGTQADHLVREAREHAQAGRPNEALQILQRALEQDPDNDGAFTQLAKIQYSAGRFEIAKEAAKVALQHNPYRSDTLYVLGRALRELGDLEGARDVLTQTTLINPLDTEALFYLSQVHLELGDREGATAALERALELEPENESFAAALAAVRTDG